MPAREAAPRAPRSRITAHARVVSAVSRGVAKKGATADMDEDEIVEVDHVGRKIDKGSLASTPKARTVTGKNGKGGRKAAGDVDVEEVEAFTDAAVIQCRSAVIKSATRQSLVRIVHSLPDLACPSPPASFTLASWLTSRIIFRLSFTRTMNKPPLPLLPLPPIVDVLPPISATSPSSSLCYRPGPSLRGPSSSRISSSTTKD